MDDFQFENDFGQSPLLVGRVTKDQAVIGVGTAIAAFASCAIGGIPLAIVVLAAGFNDILAADKHHNNQKRVPPVIDTEAETIYDDYEEEEYQGPPTPRSEAPRTRRNESKKQSPQETRQDAPTPQEALEEETIGSGWRWAGYREEVEEPAPKKRRNKEERARSDRGEFAHVYQLPHVTNRAKRELIDRLKGECPCLLKIIKDPQPIRVVGIQRTGKTTFVTILALLRMVLLPSHRVIASTPHNENNNKYPDVFEVVGLLPSGRRDYVGIRTAWNELADKIEMGCIEPITNIWDEFGVMDVAIAKAIAGGKPDAKTLKEAQEEIGLNLTSTLRESAKHKKSQIFVLHGETSTFMPGSKGIVEPLLNGTVRIETIGESIEDEDGLAETFPTGKFHVTYLNGSTDSGKIPEWLTEKYLLEILGNPVIDRSQPEPEETYGLQEPLKTIYLYAKKQNEWVTVRDVQRKDFAVLKGKGAKNIRQYLGLLADTGLGEIDEEGKSDSAVSFLAK